MCRLIQKNCLHIPLGAGTRDAYRGVIEAPMTDISNPPAFDDKDYYTLMCHFYRGEVGRIMLWRQRLDVTTNWAIAAATAILTYGLSHAETTHLVFTFANAIVLFLLIVESRRYRYYDAFRARVRMLEAHFLMPVVLLQKPSDTVHWREQLAEDLAMPAFKISRLAAVYRRFGRNYVWLFLIIGAAWAIKVWMHCAGAQTSVRGFFAAAQAGQPLPAWLFWLILGGFFGIMLWLAIGAICIEMYTPENDITGVHEKPWNI